mgnify:CR=1 FL=1
MKRAKKNINSSTERNKQVKDLFKVCFACRIVRPPTVPADQNRVVRLHTVFACFRRQMRVVVECHFLRC